MLVCFGMIIEQLLSTEANANRVTKLVEICLISVVNFMNNV